MRGERVGGAARKRGVEKGGGEVSMLCLHENLPEAEFSRAAQAVVEASGTAPSSRGGQSNCATWQPQGETTMSKTRTAAPVDCLLFRAAHSRNLPSHLLAILCRRPTHLCFWYTRPFGATSYFLMTSSSVSSAPVWA
jgi:hypothetical protein